LTLSKHKGIAKQVLGYHRIRVPQFALFPPGKKIVRPDGMSFRCIIKPTKEEALLRHRPSSFVKRRTTDGARPFIHEKLGRRHRRGIIHGRDTYVSVGNDVCSVPIREMLFWKSRPTNPVRASSQVDDDYRKRWGIVNRFAHDLDAALV